MQLLIFLFYKGEMITLYQRSPTFLAPGTGFAKTLFPQNRAGGGGGDGSGSNASDGEQQMKLGSLTLGSPPAVRPGS